MLKTTLALGSLSALIALTGCNKDTEDDTDVSVDEAGSDDGTGDDGTGDDGTGDDGTGDDGTGDDGTGTAPAETTSIRVLHLSPDAPAVDVFVNSGDDATVADLAFGEGTGYLDIPADTYSFQIAAAGATAADAVLNIDDLPLAADTSYTAVAIDYLDNISALALVDDYDGIAAGDIRLQIVHAAPGVPQVDIWVISDDGATPLLENVDFGVYATVDVPAAAYTLGFDVDDDAIPDVIFDVPNLGADQAVNVFAVNDADGNVSLRAQLPDGTMAQVDPTPDPAGIRVLHLGLDAPAVDVFVNGGATPVVEGLAFTEGTGYIEVPPDTYSFQVAVSGTSADQAVLNIEGLALESGVNYSAVAYDYVSSISALALVDDGGAILPGDIRFQVSHTAADVGEVDIWALTEGGAVPLLVDVPFGATGTIDVPAAAYTLGFDVNNDSVPDVLFDVPDLGGDQAVNVFAVNDTSGNVFLAAHLPDGTVAIVEAY